MKLRLELYILFHYSETCTYVKKKKKIFDNLRFNACLFYKTEPKTIVSQYSQYIS